MKAKLTNNYIYLAPFRGFKSDYQKYLDFKSWIKENQGQWVDIDTKYVFDNQYNTVDGYRIYDAWIDEIQDDVRTNDCFFVRHPKGKDPVKDINFEDSRKNKRFLSCSSINNNSYRISRRSNIEFILANRQIYIDNGIGYTELRLARLTNAEKDIVKYCAERILNA